MCLLLGISIPLSLNACLQFPLSLEFVVICVCSLSSSLPLEMHGQLSLNSSDLAAALQLQLTVFSCFPLGHVYFPFKLNKVLCSNALLLLLLVSFIFILTTIVFNCLTFQMHVMQSLVFLLFWSLACTLGWFQLFVFLHLELLPSFFVYLSTSEQMQASQNLPCWLTVFFLNSTNIHFFLGCSAVSWKQFGPQGAASSLGCAERRALHSSLRSLCLEQSRHSCQPGES